VRRLFHLGKRQQTFEYRSRRVEARGKVFRKNTSASILYVGDRVGLIEFHCEANAWNDELCEILVAACEEGVPHFEAVVTANRGRHFSAASNLVDTLAAAHVS
jgi:3-hydroxyacyl-CoA dehydrogenase